MENQKQIMQQQAWIMERQEESDQRFDVMLQEIHFLIRRQQPPLDDQS